MKFTQEFNDENARFEKAKRELEEKIKNSENEHWKVQRAIKKSMIERIHRFAGDYYLGETIASHGSEYWTEGKSFIGRFFVTANGEPTDLYLLSGRIACNHYAEPVPTFRHHIHSGICFQEKDSAVLEMLTRAVKSGRIYVDTWKGDLTKKDEVTPGKKDRIEDITDALFSFTDKICFEQQGSYPHQYTDSRRTDLLSRIPINELSLSEDEHQNIIRMLFRSCK